MHPDEKQMAAGVAKHLLGHFTIVRFPPTSGGAEELPHTGIVQEITFPGRFSWGRDLKPQFLRASPLVPPVLGGLTHMQFYLLSFAFTTLLLTV